MINKADLKTLKVLYRDGISFCSENDISPIMVAFTGRPDAELLELCSGNSQVSGVVLPEGCEDRDLHGLNQGRLIASEFNWELPEGRVEALVYLGPGMQLNFRMALRARRQGIRWFVFPGPARWQKIELSVFLRQRMWERIRTFGASKTIGARSKLRNISRRIARAAWLLYVKRIRHTQDGGTPSFVETPFRLLIDRFEESAERQYHNAINANHLPLLESTDFVANRVLLTNASLAWGGAERQVANTLVGLKNRGYEDLLLLCEHLHDRPEHDFYLEHLESAGVEVREREHFFPPIDGVDVDILSKMSESLDYLPNYMRDDILSFAVEIIKYRPAIFHAWQDSTSIKAGFAAAMVGVPNIILNGRNMAPYNFAYFLPYMRSMYSVLARLKSVTFMNNSTAGAADYEQWIGLERGRVKVLHNGLRNDNFRPVNHQEKTEFRKKIGIPESAPVVGAIYRLSEEKGPFLWLDTAAEIASKLNDVCFLIIGKGPLKEKMWEYARKLGIERRLFMPGTEKKPQIAFAAMDVFLMTSRLEGTPNVCIEAQWMGLPVVAPDVGGTADTILDGETGWVVPKRDKKMLADRTLSALTDQDWRERAIQMAPEFAQKRFGFERMIDDTIEVYGLT